MFMVCNIVVNLRDQVVKMHSDRAANCIVNMLHSHVDCTIVFNVVHNLVHLDLDEAINITGIQAISKVPFCVDIPGGDLHECIVVDGFPVGPCQCGLPCILCCLFREPVTTNWN
jgi:hypothetical protein